MYSPVAVTDPAEAARAVAEAAKSSGKAVLAAWLGDINPSESRVYLEAHGIANFYTPENAVEAFSFVRDYRRNQAQLLEVPSATASSVDWKADLSAARSIRDAALSQGRELLSESEAKRLLAAFGLPVPRSVIAATRERAMEAAQEIGFPVVIKIHSPDITHKSDVGGVRLDLQNAAMLGSAFDEMMRNVAAMRPDARVEGVAVQPMLRYAHAREVLVGVATDAVFGPVISFGSGGVSVEAVRDTAVALPPLNAALAHELMERTRVHRLLAGYRDVPAADLDALAAVLCGVSRMVCALPWLKEMDLNPVLAHPGGAMIADARVVNRFVEPPRERRATPTWRSILTRSSSSRRRCFATARGSRSGRCGRRTSSWRRASSTGSRSARATSASCSTCRICRRRCSRASPSSTTTASSRWWRCTAANSSPWGATRRIPTATRRNSPCRRRRLAGQGARRALLERLCDAARNAGYEALYGNILAANHDMLDLAARLGFEERSRDGTEVTVSKNLEVAASRRCSTLETPWRRASASSTSSSCAAAKASPSASWRAAGGDAELGRASPSSARRRRAAGYSTGASAARSSQRARGRRACAAGPRRRTGHGTPTGTPSPRNARASRAPRAAAAGELRLAADAVHQDVVPARSALLAQQRAKDLGGLDAAVAHRHRADRQQAVARRVEAAGLAVDHHPARRGERRAAEPRHSSKSSAQALLQQRGLAERLLQHAPVDGVQRGHAHAVAVAAGAAPARNGRRPPRPPSPAARSRAAVPVPARACGEREHARRVDERPRAERLEVELVGGKVAQQPERRARLHGGLRQRAQKARLAARCASTASRSAPARRASPASGGKSKKMLALSSASGSGCGSSRRTRPPSCRRQAPARVARHDVALAQRKAAGVEAAVDLVGEREERSRWPPSTISALSWSVTKRLLHAPLAAEREPAPARRAARGAPRRARSGAATARRSARSSSR